MKSRMMAWIASAAVGLSALAPGLAQAHPRDGDRDGRAGWDVRDGYRVDRDGDDANSWRQWQERQRELRRIEAERGREAFRERQRELRAQRREERLEQRRQAREARQLRRAEWREGRWQGPGDWD